MSAEEYLARFTRVLDERGIAVAPVLAVVHTVGFENVFLGVGTLSERLQLLIPAHPDALATVAPGATLPQRSMLLVSANTGVPITAAVVIGGATTPRQFVDEVRPVAVRHLWLPIIETLTGTVGAAIKNRIRYLCEERGTITISYAERSDAEQVALGAELEILAARLGISGIWRHAYDYAGPRASIGVTTECMPAGPAPRITLRFGTATWDQVIDLAKAMFDVDKARNAAVRMGLLASELGVDSVRGVEAVFDQAAPDLIVWLKLG